MIRGRKKKVLQEVTRYYVETTGNSYDQLVYEMQKINNSEKTGGELSLSTSEWLSFKILGILKGEELSITDCIENKDILNSSINEVSSRGEGEFYTPEVWCKEGRNYLQEMLGDLWGKAYIWDASCGTGNLMRTAGYPKDKLFLSTLLEEDVKITQKAYEGVEVFKCDFLNGLDYDQFNMNFSEQLPDSLRKVLENNEPLVFYMNPPYLQVKSRGTDVGDYMSSIGLTKGSLDMFNQFLYRIIMLKHYYGLTNVYVGVFGPTTLYFSKETQVLMREIKSEFTFKDGFFFDAGEFGLVSDSKWAVGYTMWGANQTDKRDETPIDLTYKTFDRDTQTLKNKGKRVFQSEVVRASDWIKPHDIVNYGGMLPFSTSITKITTRGESAPLGVMGYMYSTGLVRGMVRHSGILSLPFNSSEPVLEDNFWRCVGVYAASVCYRKRYKSRSSGQNLCAPNTNIEGYEDWLANALALYLFDNGATFAAYRDIEMDKTIIDTPNRSFPLSAEEVKSLTEDETILQDIEKQQQNGNIDNHFLLKAIEESRPRLTKEATLFFDYCLEMIRNSLRGSIRKEKDYPLWTNAWDASFNQIRRTKVYMTEEEEREYYRLMSDLNDRLIEGVYKYGFILDIEKETEHNYLDGKGISKNEKDETKMDMTPMGHA